MSRKMVILTQGYTNPHTAKTARNLIRYRPEEVIAIYDDENTGKFAAELLGFGEDVPVIGTLDNAPGADTLLIGIATPGGIIPPYLKPIILEAISRGMNVISGLHNFLSDDPDIYLAAQKYEVELTDVRKTDFKQVANRKGIRQECLRVQTVGNDCSLGKMVVSLEIDRWLKDNGYDSSFVPTGQTGILIEGTGIPIDNISGDYINGAAEQMVLENQHHDMMMIEGQGSLVHPRYSSVTLGLLHGAQPHALIMCYELGREVIHGVESFRIPPMREVMKVYETMANIMGPCEIIGMAINSRKSTQKEADMERERAREEFGLPVCDVVRHGPEELGKAVADYYTKFREKLPLQETNNVYK